MEKATSGKRILAFIIDAILLGIVLSILNTVFFTSQEYIEASEALSNAYINGSITFEEYSLQLSELKDPFALAKAITTFVLTLGYYVILPLFYKKQTIGRQLTRILVVKENGNKADFVSLLIREAFGQTLISSLLLILSTLVPVLSTFTGFIDLVLVIILIVGFFKMLGASKLTLYDKFSKTLTVLEESYGKTLENENPDQEVIDL